MNIHKSKEEDRAALEQLYPLAFPDEDLLPLLRELLDEQDNILSLVTRKEDETLTGHVVFTICSVNGCSNKVALLGPIAVQPYFQKQGIGGTLIRKGFDFVREGGVSEVYVLGDPEYYGRFGFKQCDHVCTPYDIPEAWRPAWQFINLLGEEPSIQGRLSVPKPWRYPKLWS